MQPLDLPYWEGKIEEYARKGYGWWPQLGSRLPQADQLTGICSKGILLGVAGMMDPPRPEAITAIACRPGSVKMITGDHPQRR